MSLYVNGTFKPYHEDIISNGVSLTEVWSNGVKVWTKVYPGSFYAPAISNHTVSYSSCADQHGGVSKHYGDSDKIEFDFYDNVDSSEIPSSQYPLLSISNSGLIWQSSTTNDPNNICRTKFIFSFLGYTYKVVNETKNKYLQRKPYGSSDASYVTIASGAQQYNGYTYLTINIGWTTRVYLGNGGQIDLESMIGHYDYNASGYVYEPEYAYAQNFHYNGCTSGYCYAVSFTQI